MSKKREPKHKPVVASNPKRVRSIRLPDSMWKKVEKIAEEEKIPPSEVIRNILHLHFVRGDFDAILIDRLATLESRMDELDKQSKG